MPGRVEDRAGNTRLTNQRPGIEWRTNQVQARAEVTGCPGGRRPSVVSIGEEATGDGW